MKRFSPLIVAMAVIAIGCVWLRWAGLPVWEISSSLAFGWWRFLTRVLPRQHVSLSGMATAAICASLLLLGLHAFLRWLTDAWNADRPDAIRWRFRWTAYLLGMTLLMFAAGTAFVGVMHQATWLVNSSEPRTVMAPDQRWYGEAEDSLKMVGLGLLNYESTFKVVPPGDDPQYSGGVQHSWQTLILPYLPYNNSAYRKDQPWNAAENKAFCSRPVELYLVQGTPGDFRNHDGYAVSHYAGNSRLFLAARDRKVRLNDINAHTLVAGEAAGNFRAWADPANLRDPVDELCGTPDGFGNAAGTRRALFARRWTGSVF
jgi:hypothetical protein